MKPVVDSAAGAWLAVAWSHGRCAGVKAGPSLAPSLSELIDRASRGTSQDVDDILGHLTPDATLAVTKFVDYALSHVDSRAGVARIEHHLFNGTQMQRNYCSLFFNRRGDWLVVKRAYAQGLIDAIQAYAR